MIKHFYSQIMNIFLEVATQQKNLGKSFLVVKAKRKLFWRIADTLSQILRKTLQKTKIHTNLMSRGPCETGHNSGAIYMIIFNRFL